MDGPDAVGVSFSGSLCWWGGHRGSGPCGGFCLSGIILDQGQRGEGDDDTVVMEMVLVLEMAIRDSNQEPSRSIRHKTRQYALTNSNPGR